MYAASQVSFRKLMSNKWFLVLYSHLSILRHKVFNIKTGKAIINSIHLMEKQSMTFVLNCVTLCGTYFTNFWDLDHQSTNCETGFSWISWFLKLKTFRDSLRDKEGRGSKWERKKNRQRHTEIDAGTCSPVEIPMF